MQARRYLYVMSFFLGLWLAACAGGSGSSGFDSFPSSENAAINEALSTQECVEFEGLSICPAETAETVPPISTPTPEPTTTPTEVVVMPVPSASPTVVATFRTTPTATRTPTATPRVHPSKPGVGTDIRGGAIACAQIDAVNCIFVVPFVTDGFPAGTTFRLAVRAVNPLGSWAIGADLAPAGPANAPIFDATAAVDTPRAPDSVRVQLAVLAFVTPTAAGPTEVQMLGDSGADYAFVTEPVTLQPTAPLAQQ